MAYPKFTKNALSWTSTRGNTFPIEIEYEPNQIIDESISGNIQVSKVGETKQIFNLKYEGLNQTNYDNLISFLTDSSVDWFMNTFTYTDEAENSYTVRLLSFTSQQVAFQLYNVSIRLRKQLTTE